MGRLVCSRCHVRGLDQLQHELGIGLKERGVLFGILDKNLGTLRFDFLSEFWRVERLGDGGVKFVD